MSIFFSPFVLVQGRCHSCKSCVANAGTSFAGSSAARGCYRPERDPRGSTEEDGGGDTSAPSPPSRDTGFRDMGNADARCCLDLDGDDANDKDVCSCGHEKVEGGERKEKKNVYGIDV